jgi:lysozyme
MNRLSAAGIKALHEREGLELEAYQDDKGVWTIGYGHTANWIKAGVAITQAKADQLFADDIEWAQRAVTNYVRVYLNQNQYDSLVSFTFNIGETQLIESTLLRELNKKNYLSVPRQLMRWNKITVDEASGRKEVLQGLTNRRTSEVAQWNSMVAVCEPCSATPSEPKGRAPLALLASSRQTQAGVTATGAGTLGILKENFAEVSEVINYLPDVATYSAYILIGFGLFVVARRYFDSRNGRAD